MLNGLDIVNPLIIIPSINDQFHPTPFTSTLLSNTSLVVQQIKSRKVGFANNDNIAEPVMTLLPSATETMRIMIF